MTDKSPHIKRKSLYGIIMSMKNGFDYFVPETVLLSKLTLCIPVLIDASLGLQIRGGKGYFSIDFLEFSIKN